MNKCIFFLVCEKCKHQHGVMSVFNLNILIRAMFFLRFCAWLSFISSVGASDMWSCKFDHLETGLQRSLSIGFQSGSSLTHKQKH